MSSAVPSVTLAWRRACAASASGKQKPKRVSVAFATSGDPCVIAGPGDCCEADAAPRVRCDGVAGAAAGGNDDDADMRTALPPCVMATTSQSPR
eukprot:11942488-Heterocapsa_arctica.AAC.2